jgi:hypothetical protein
VSDADAAIAEALKPTTKAGTLGKLADLLDRSGIDLDDVARVTKVRAWQGFYKDSDGQAQTVDMHGIELVPSWTDGPQWPVVAQGPAVRMPVRHVKPRPATGWQTAIVLPDMQVGYFRAAGDELEPIHDEAALSVALSIIKAENPALIVMVGDNADFAEFGKYRLSVAYARTTQATIDRLTVLGAELRHAAPNARIVWLAGNHEERLPNYILDNASAAFGLRKGAMPDSWPVMSMPYLCRFDDHGVEYVPGYPAGSVWINHRLRVIHGDKVASGGSTAHKYLAAEKTSVIYGHVHRREWAERTRLDHDGPKTILAASPGCLARCDGAVPSTKGGYDLDGRPVRIAEDWQQGIAVVRFEPGDGRFVYEQVPIRDGWAMHQGREFAA